MVTYSIMLILFNISSQVQSQFARMWRWLHSYSQAIKVHKVVLKQTERLKPEEHIVDGQQVILLSY